MGRFLFAALVSAAPMCPGAACAAEHPTYARIEAKDVAHTATRFGWLDCGGPAFSLVDVEVKGVHQADKKATARLTAVAGPPKDPGAGPLSACARGDRRRVSFDLYQANDGRWFIPIYYEFLEKAP